MRKYKPSELFELKILVDNLDIHLSEIDTSAITDMSWLFYKSPRTNFEGIEDWDVSNLENADCLFLESSFNRNINSWNVSKLRKAREMFHKTPYNQPLGEWDTSSLEDASFMFANSEFNQDIREWKLPNLVDAGGMFASTPFNYDISCWQMPKIRIFAGMFLNTNFAYDISSWNFDNVSKYRNETRCDRFFGLELPLYTKGLQEALKKTNTRAYMIEFSKKEGSYILVNKNNMKYYVLDNAYVLQKRFDLAIEEGIHILKGKKVEALCRSYYSGSEYFDIKLLKAKDYSSL